MLGHNGAGKSTLLKIMAGIDKEFGGEAWAAEGVKIGYLSQEPQLNESKDVLGNANYLTAAICQATNGQPSDVCSSAGVSQAKAQLGG